MGDHESWALNYDLFQVDGRSRIWCTQVIGLLYAGYKLRELSSNSRNECYAVQESTNEVVARLSIPGCYLGAPRAFHIAYDVAFADKLAQHLPWLGYRFNYAAGNTLACAILTRPMRCNVFMLDYAAPLDTRRDMAAWLAASYPHVPIVALKLPSEPDVAPSQFNLQMDSDQVLLPTLAEALALRWRRSSPAPSIPPPEAVPASRNRHRTPPKVRL